MTRTGFTRRTVAVAAASLATVVAVTLPWTATLQARTSENAKPGCSVRMLKGAYGFSYSGTIIGVGPIAGAGVYRFDGAGHFSGVETQTVNGSPGSHLTGTGTYSVNPDCTGSSTTTYDDGQVVQLELVLVTHGREILTLAAFGGVAVTGVFKEQ